MKIGVLSSYPKRVLRIIDADTWEINSEYSNVMLYSGNTPVAAFSSWDAVYRHEDVKEIRRILLAKEIKEAS